MTDAKPPPLWLRILCWPVIRFAVAFGPVKCWWTKQHLEREYDLIGQKVAVCERCAALRIRGTWRHL